MVQRPLARALCEDAHEEPLDQVDHVPGVDCALEGRIDWAAQCAGEADVDFELVDDGCAV